MLIYSLGNLTLNRNYPLEVYNLLRTKCINKLLFFSKIGAILLRWLVYSIRILRSHSEYLIKLVQILAVSYFIEIKIKH